MSVIERDVVLQSVDESGRQTMDFPITRLGNVEDTADVKAAPAAGDYLPIVDSEDGGQMKKTAVSALLAPFEEAVQEALDAAVQTAVQMALGEVEIITAAEIDAIMNA